MGCRYEFLGCVYARGRFVVGRGSVYRKGAAAASQEAFFSRWPDRPTPSEVLPTEGLSIDPWIFGSKLVRTSFFPHGARRGLVGTLCTSRGGGPAVNGGFGLAEMSASISGIDADALVEGQPKRAERGRLSGERALESS